ncbi:MAG: tRNA pseudouridine(55) synthase TruB [Deltaproteobacteria bacterium]|nr:tRNA pseudouridine(55) synthase TruB [Deltaproteobacteria bacterium]
MTSHDVVQWVRRAMGQKRVGHCGTLDPMATGVLVVALGEATKLVQLLSADEKEYEATVALGTATDTGDADGAVVGRMQVGSLDEAEVRALFAAMIGARRQRPPAVSAIKVGGVALHERVRRGEVVEAPERDVVVHALELVSLDDEAKALRLRVVASKGFYVRSLAAEIAAALGTVGHLTALRRLRAGRFDLAHAVDADVVRRAAAGGAAEKAEIARRLLPWSRVREVVPCVEVGAEDAARLRVGKHVEGVEWPAAGDAVLCALSAGSGLPVALVRLEGGAIVVVRGFVSPP